MRQRTEPGKLGHYPIGLRRMCSPAHRVRSPRNVYGYDAAGNITALHDALDPGYHRDFSYDNLNRLVTANGGAALWGNGTYSYDGMGNMLFASLGKASRTFHYAEPTPQLTSVDDGTLRPVTYDGVGNELTVGTLSNTYSPRNLLAAEGPASYRFDGRGIRTAIIAPAPPAVLSLSLATVLARGEAEVEAEITLNDPAPVGGLVVQLSSDTAAATVPASISVLQGNLSAVFAITIAAVTTPTTATIVASLGSSSATETLLIEPSGLLQSLAFDSGQLATGASTTGTITLSGPAPAGGALVALTTSLSGILSLPATATVPAGQTQTTITTFTVDTEAVTEPNDVTITATMNGFAQRVLLVVVPNAQTVTLQSVFIPSGVLGGNAVTGTVTLSSPAPAGGALVALTGSRNGVASIPASVTVAPGATSANFSVTTQSVLYPRGVLIAAAYNSLVRTDVLVVNDNPQLRLPPSQTSASTFIERDASAVTSRSLATQSHTTQRLYFYTPELNLLAETEITESAAPAIQHEYIWFAGQPVAQIATATNEIAWYFNDHLGTPILQSDASANVVWRVEREPYGEIFATRAGAQRHQPLAFPGQEDNGGETSYNIFRWYRSGWGRYSSADPIGLRGGANLYRYANANPQTYIDPYGLAYFAKRKLQGQLWIPYASCNPIDDAQNTEFSHEQLFFEDGKSPANLGFFADNKVKEDDTSGFKWQCKSGQFNDCIMRKAAASVTPKQYCAIGKPGVVDQYNCQNWADDVRKAYAKLKSDPAVQKECCGKK